MAKRCETEDEDIPPRSDPVDDEGSSRVLLSVGVMTDEVVDVGVDVVDVMAGRGYCEDKQTKSRREKKKRNLGRERRKEIRKEKEKRCIGSM